MATTGYLREGIKKKLLRQAEDHEYVIALLVWPSGPLNNFFFYFILFHSFKQT